MKLGTKLTIYLSLIIVVVLSGYGYFHSLNRREILIRKMKVEVRSIGQTLKVALEKVSIPGERDYVQEVIDTVEEDEKILGVIVHHQGNRLIFHSRSLNEKMESSHDAIETSIQENHPQEEFRMFKDHPVFSYTFPLQDGSGRNIGGVSILQHTSFVEEDIKKDKRNLFLMIFVLVGVTVVLILFATKRWINQPISRLMEGINKMAKGDLDTRIDFKRGDELSELAQAFNQMAVDLKEAQQRLIQEADTRLELERSLRQSEKLATIGQLASGLAHEIGTPLNIISGRAELMKRRYEDREGIQKDLDGILHQSERITKIIRQLLGFARKKRPEQKSLNIPSLLETTLDFLDPPIQRQGVKVVKNINGDLPPVTGDSDQLQQVFLNLFLNAIQSMPRGGELHLSASAHCLSKEGLEDGQRQYVEVCVEDTGSGMEREVMEYIFSPFFTTKEKGQGTGLGLTVSEGIVQDHDGWIDVSSEIGKGSVFKVYLPTMEG